jgi:hypothetical protein
MSEEALGALVTRDSMVGVNCAGAGLAWRSTRQSLAKRRIHSGDAPREFTA